MIDNRYLLTTFHLAVKCALGFLVTMAMTGLWQTYMLHPSAQQMVWFYINIQ